jgi:hypothetical protein
LPILEPESRLNTDKSGPRRATFTGDFGGPESLNWTA